MSTSDAANLDITGVGPEQFTSDKKTEVSVNVPLVNLCTLTASTDHNHYTFIISTINEYLS